MKQFILVVVTFVLFSCNDDGNPVEETECTADNSITTSLNAANNDPNADALTPVYTEVINGDLREITSNQVPNHNYGSPVALISESSKTFKMDATPTTASTKTTLLGATRIDWIFGIALNGVKLDPEALFPFENTTTGEQNWDWVLEATNNTNITTLDANQAHLQANGAYHYHGDFVDYATLLNIDGSKMVQVAWAADGYPVYYKYAYNTATDASSGISEMQSSYQLKAGDRPGDGVSAPCGAYSGKYGQDYEYTNGSGDLDECNGRTGVTPEFPGGTYYYVMTGNYPIIPRCFNGTPHNSFGL